MALVWLSMPITFSCCLFHFLSFTFVSFSPLKRIYTYKPKHYICIYFTFQVSTINAPHLGFQFFLLSFYLFLSVLIFPSLRLHFSADPDRPFFILRYYLSFIFVISWDYFAGCFNFMLKALWVLFNFPYALFFFLQFFALWIEMKGLLNEYLPCLNVVLLGCEFFSPFLEIVLFFRFERNCLSI